MALFPSGRFHRKVAAALAFALAAGGFSAAAYAAPSDDDIENSRRAEAALAATVAGLELQLVDIQGRREAAQLASQIASEEYQYSRDQLAIATKTAEEARAGATAARQEEQAARARLAQVATNAYRNGGGSLSAIEPYLTEGGLTEIDSKAAAVDHLGSRAEAEVQNYNALEQTATTLERRATAAEAEQAAATSEVEVRFKAAQDQAAALTAEEQALDAERNSVLGALAAQRGTTVELERQRDEENERIRREQAEAEARRIAEENARIERERQEREDRERRERERQEREERERQEREWDSSDDGGDEGDEGDSWQPAPAPAPAPPAPPVVNGGAAGAIAFARNAIGVPYLWGGESMAGYDCSGLVQAAWGSQGYWLSHSSRMQYAETSRVPLAALQPGDLVFWSSNGTGWGIYHVAIYSGNGMIIHAPQPGDYVKEIPLYYSGGIMPYGGRVG